MICLLSMHLRDLAFFSEFLLFGPGDANVAIPTISLEVVGWEIHLKSHILFIRE